MFNGSACWLACVLHRLLTISGFHLVWGLFLGNGSQQTLHGLRARQANCFARSLACMRDRLTAIAWAHNSMPGRAPGCNYLCVLLMFLCIWPSPSLGLRLCASDVLTFTHTYRCILGNMTCELVGAAAGVLAHTPWMLDLSLLFCALMFGMVLRWHKIVDT